MSITDRFPTLRQSRLATFDRCALSSSFEEEYMSGWSTTEQASGTIFHRVAERIIKTLYEQNERRIPTDAAIAILDEVLRQNDIDQRCPGCGKPIVKVEGGRTLCAAGHSHTSDFVNIPMSAVKDLRWIVVKFATDHEWDIENLVDVEQRLKATIAYGNGVERVLTGAIDALFVNETGDEFIVIDYKSGWGLPGPSALGFDGYFQQRFYAWLIFRNYPSAQRVTLRELYVRFSEPRTATVWRADIEDVEAELAALAERFDRAHAERNFPATPGVHCQMCPRPEACPIFPAVRQDGAITTRQEAARVARQVTVAQAALKGRKDALAAWTSVHGSEEVSSHKGRRVWGHKTVQRTARPSKQDMEAALAAARSGVPINLDQLYKTAATTRFELHTPQPHEDPSPEAVDAELMSALEASVDAATVARNPTQEEAA